MTRRMMHMATMAAFILVCIMFSAHTASSCTGIRLTGSDGTVVYGRTMEWGAFDWQTTASVTPRGHSFQVELQDGADGMAWTGEYGFVAFSLQDRVPSDGMNEKGLTAGMFYHHGFAEYAKYDPALADRSLAPTDVIAYLLSSFATVDDVIQGMQGLRVVPVADPALNMPPPIHCLVTDTEGNSLVIEFTDGEIALFDNPVGVITNNPRFDWHLTNLRNYGFLSNEPFPKKQWGDMEITPLAGGSGMLGLPGDYTSPSRFVRAAALVQTARQTTGGEDTVHEFFRIMDSFNVPATQGEGSSMSKHEDLPSSTQWTSCYDTKNRIVYYHTAYNRRVRRIDFDAIDFDAKGVRSTPLDAERVQDVKDVTERLE